MEPSEAGLEARVGFEPTNGGFADLSLRPLGYRAVGSSIAEAKEAGEAEEAGESRSLVPKASQGRHSGLGTTG